MEQTIDVDSMIRSGDISPIFTWLSDNIWNKDSLLTTDELVKQAIGEIINATYFKEHLKIRYLDNWSPTK